MAERRKYTEIVASLETHIIYINNHLKNIDSHCDRINNTIAEQAKGIQKNTTWISAIRWAIGMFITGVLVWMSRLQGWWG